MASALSITATSTPAAAEEDLGCLPQSDFLVEMQERLGFEQVEQQIQLQDQSFQNHYLGLWLFENGSWVTYTYEIQNDTVLFCIDNLGQQYHAK